ncbi:MAG: pyruvate kinase [Anaerolineales bacterium]
MGHIKLPEKKTKIVCTIGPASQSKPTLEKMISRGMNVARLNFAHGDFENHREIIANVRAAAKASGKRVAVMGDLPGPKMRIGRLAKEPIQLIRGQEVVLQTQEIIGDSSRFSVSFANMPSVVKPGDRIFLNDGFIQLVVLDIKGEEIRCKVEVGDELRSFKGINLPGIELGIQAFTERDWECLQFAAEQGLDAISQSFIQESSDIETVRRAANELEYFPFIIAKIERARAVENLEDILNSTDGIMVARGDLGVEIPIEMIAVTQKHIIRRANIYGKPVITATQMLESMVNHTRPTRAEATDVANAILDGTDCLMLSGETATGSYPVETVNVMACIAKTTEKSVKSEDLDRMIQAEKIRGEISNADLISLTINYSISKLEPSLVITPTLSGSTPRRVCRFRPPIWIVAVSPNESTCQALQFSYGVYPVLEPEKPESWEVYARKWRQNCEIEGDLVLLTQGSGAGGVGGTNKLEIIDLSRPPAEPSVW